MIKITIIITIKTIESLWLNAIVDQQLHILFVFLPQFWVRQNWWTWSRYQGGSGGGTSWWGKGRSRPSCSGCCWSDPPDTAWPASSLSLQSWGRLVHRWGMRHWCRSSRPRVSETGSIRAGPEERKLVLVVYYVYYLMYCVMLCCLLSLRCSSTYSSSSSLPRVLLVW